MEGWFKSAVLMEFSLSQTYSTFVVFLLCHFNDILPCFGCLRNISDPQQDGKTTNMCIVPHNNGGQG